MQTDTTPSPEELEAEAIRFSNDFARRKRWKECTYLKEPILDLRMFFDRLNGRKIIDVGCGWARYAYHFFDHELDYIGIDHSIGMLEAAREQYPDADFRQLSHNQPLPFASESFDGIWCAFALGHEQKRTLPGTFNEFRRILKSDGTIFIGLPLFGRDHEELITTDEGFYLWNAEYSIDQIQALLMVSGFKIDEAIEYPDFGSFSVFASPT